MITEQRMGELKQIREGTIEKGLRQARELLGKRIEIPVHYDMWMRGARFGQVTRIGKDGAFVYVKMDHPQVRRRLKLWRIDYDYAKIV
jgi:hypothetical protein